MVFKGVKGQVQPFPIGGQGQIVVGHLGYQADLKAMARLFGGKILLQGLILQASDSAEKINFVGAQAHAQIVIAGNHGLSTAGNIRRKALDSSATRGSNGWQLIGSLDPELGARFFNVQRRHAQIAVIGQGQTDQLLQLRVNKKTGSTSGLWLPPRQGGAVLVGRAGAQVAETGASGRL